MLTIVGLQVYIIITTQNLVRLLAINNTTDPIIHCGL